MDVEGLLAVWGEKGSSLEIFPRLKIVSGALRQWIGACDMMVRYKLQPPRIDSEASLRLIDSEYASMFVRSK